jgi:hypothetical protein
MDINVLRKMRGQSFAKINTAFDKIANPGQGSYKDDRFWKLEADKAGNASATIRFLNVTGDGLPWVKVFSHAFQGPGGKWYIENSLSTIGLTDYVGEQNSKLWNSGIEENKKIAQKQKRKLQYIANILVVTDPKHPENEGKVMLFKFGKKIFDKIMDKAQPTFADEAPVNVFDYWDGADFKLRMKKVEGFPNYDSSVFAEPAPIGEDEEILKVAEKIIPLDEFVDPTKFKSYDELKAKYLSVMNEDAPASRAADKDDLPSAAAPAPSRAAPAPSKPSRPAPAADVSEDDDDSLAFFRGLAEDD